MANREAIGTASRRDDTGPAAGLGDLGPGVCDAHLHVFGDPGRYPPAATAGYAPPPATTERYLEVAGRAGVDRFVLVQPSIYGEDNSCVLDALAVVGAHRARGVAIVDEPPPPSVLDEWDRAGIRGLRVIGFPPGRTMHVAWSQHPPGVDFLDEVRRRIEVNARLAAQRGWHLDLLVPGPVLTSLADTLAVLPVDYTVAHIGLTEAAGGLGRPEFATLLDLLTDPAGRCWIKLTAPYRLSRRPGHLDVAPFVQAVLRTAPDRVLWGSDWPHVQFADQVETGSVVAQLRDWIPDPALARRTLVDNPASLYGFDS